MLETLIDEYEDQENALAVIQRAILALQMLGEANDNATSLTIIKTVNQILKKFA
jgi:hypothetical protein